MERMSKFKWSFKKFIKFLAALICVLAVYKVFFQEKPAPIPLMEPVEFSSDAPKTFFWDGEELVKIRERLQKDDPVLQPAFERLIQEADQKLLMKPFSVTHKKNPPYSAHDYTSLAPYFWPNAWTGKPYWLRDGRINPEAETDQYDRTRYLELLRALQKLSLAYYFTGEDKYAERVFELIRVWFLDESTRMNPHFKHAQIIPGLTGGFSLGIIRGTELVQMLDALALCQPHEHWTQKDDAALKDWFRQYFKWVRGSLFGKIEYRMHNNHGTWYDAHTSSVALFLNDEKAAREILLKSTDMRIEKQIHSDGTQPAEMNRSRSWYYPIYNLRGLFAIASQSERVGINMWGFIGNDGQSLKSALDYLIPFATQKEDWNREQVYEESEWVADMVPLLCMAAKKYQDEKYLKVIQQMPPFPANHMVRLLYSF